MSDAPPSLTPYWRDFGIPALVTAAVLGGVRYLWRSITRRMRIRAAERRKAEAGADLARILGRLLIPDPSGGGPSRPEILESGIVAAAELESARRALWRAQGRPDPVENKAAAAMAREFLREMRRMRQTQEIKPIDDRPQDVFADEEERTD